MTVIRNGRERRSESRLETRKEVDSTRSVGKKAKGLQSVTALAPGTSLAP